MTSTQSRNRGAGFGSANEDFSNASEQLKTGSRPFGTALGNGASTWMTGGTGSIWADNTYGAASKNGRSDSYHVQDSFTGSSSRDISSGSRPMISTSDMDNASLRQSPWDSLDEPPSFASLSASRSRASPEQKQTGHNHPPPAFAGPPDTDPVFPFNKASDLLQAPPSQSKAGRLNPTSEDFEVPSLMRSGHVPFTKSNMDHDGLSASQRGRFEFGQQGGDNAIRNKSISGYNSSVASRTNSVPPSRNDLDLSSPSPGELPFLPPGRLGSNVGLHRANPPSNGSHGFLMPTGSSHSGLREQLSSSRLDTLAGQLDHLKLHDATRKPSYPSLQYSPNSTSNHFPSVRPVAGTSQSCSHWNEEYSNSSTQRSPTGSSSSYSRHQFRGGVDGPYLDSPVDSEARISHHSPFYSTNGTPPGMNHHHHCNSRNPLTGMPLPAALDRRLRGLQQQQQVLPSHHSPLAFRNHMNLPFDVNSQQPFLNPYYQMPPARHLLSNAHVPQGPARDPDPTSQNRNPLLEEFKNNSKTNRRWELKDIYGSIVDFSGDQHGSRFVQQKLETANSDEKEQIFREILHDAYQLMTDIFGNYVIQKFFEHGNQVQKKTLAMQMKNRVFSLSLQTYGCRVVQKALEHVLTDQQAELIRELSVDVMKCVQDQNGNHVIQMAIQRVPAEHIDFIVKAFNRRVYENAKNPYGCRVIQRMLEHCDEGTKMAVMQEMHACASALIPDQYGNYVTQHIIQHGTNDDRMRIIRLVISNLVNYSKHKFASNVVEKSIEFGTREERVSIVQQLTVTNERNESPVQGLIRDQYGNYVVQKLLTQLQGQEWTDFAEPVKIQVGLLKRFAYGKQVASVEKLLYRGHMPPHIPTSGIITPTMDSSAAPTPALASDLSQSPQSSSLPSTHTDSVDAPPEPRKINTDHINIFTGTTV